MKHATSVGVEFYGGISTVSIFREARVLDCCDSLSSFPLGIFPKLSTLGIYGCQNLESLYVEGRAVENLSHLDYLSLRRCPNLVSFPDGGLPTPHLTSFSVWGCKSLKLLPDGMHTLTDYLWIQNLPNLESLAKGGMPRNLQAFWIENCERLRPSEEWGLQGLVSLQEFIITRNKDLLETLLKEHLLPATLLTLKISHLSNLKSLDGKGLGHPTSLQQLEISWCQSLEFLPKEGFPASLSWLSIENCPSLKRSYRNKKGKDWRNISRIPCIKIDDEVTIL
ncbi:putative disease resistance protein At3g14460 [Malus domestica]|uniref:putative disease resistance protein At3g14460 n=1 Tax=Malus domestica TaxID=3750 RepID=UPI003974C2F2